MAHAQKPDSVFQRNGRVHLYRGGVSSVEYWLSWSEGRGRTIVVTLDGLFRVKLKTADYPHHSPLSPSLLLPCVTVCHQIQFPLYKLQQACRIEFHKICGKFIGYMANPIYGLRQLYLSKFVAEGKRSCPTTSSNGFQWVTKKCMLNGVGAHKALFSCFVKRLRRKHHFRLVTCCGLIRKKLILKAEWLL